MKYALRAVMSILLLMTSGWGCATMRQQRDLPLIEGGPGESLKQLTTLMQTPSGPRQTGVPTSAIPAPLAVEDPSREKTTLSPLPPPADLPIPPARAIAPSPQPLERGKVSKIPSPTVLGDPNAQYNLGLMYENGQGLPRDYAEAVKWYRKAAEQGFADAQNNLGVMYDNGRGVPPDYAEAVKWYRKSAEQGNSKAQYNLGVMYESGQGVPRNYAEAAKWFRKAAEQGDASAQYNLGVLYRNGQGVKQDYAEAAKWLRKAAEQGDASAQFAIGTMCFNGQGVQRDYVQSYFWFSLAASRSAAEDKEKYSGARDVAAKKLTSKILKEAQRKILEWEKSHPRK